MMSGRPLILPLTFKTTLFIWDHRFWPQWTLGIKQSLLLLFLRTSDSTFVSGTLLALTISSSYWNSKLDWNPPVAKRVCTLVLGPSLSREVLNRMEGPTYSHLKLRIRNPEDTFSKGYQYHEAWELERHSEYGILPSLNGIQSWLFDSEFDSLFSPHLSQLGFIRCSLSRIHSSFWCSNRRSACLRTSNISMYTGGAMQFQTMPKFNPGASSRALILGKCSVIS